jgi:hypothetical protein
MKKYYYILAVVFFFAGCSVEKDTIGPDFSQLEKSWLKINTGLTVEEQISVCKVFNGASGGNFNFNDKPDNIKINGKLVVPANSFSGDLEICITLDGQTTFITFAPEYEFTNPLFLDLTFRNVDLRGVNPEELEFYYIDDAGALQPAEYESQVIDIDKGILKITKVKIHHFSRYGWAK